MTAVNSQEPLLQYAILCDAVAKDQSGKAVYVGEFDRLLRPSILPQFFIGLKWICGIGTHKFSLKILDPELNTLQTFDDMEMKFEKKTDNARVHIQVVNFNFKTPGVYWIEVCLNGEDYLSVPLPVHDNN